MMLNDYTQGQAPIVEREDDHTFGIDQYGKIYPPLKVPIVKLEDLEKAAIKVEQQIERLKRSQIPRRLEGYITMRLTA